MHSIKSTFSFEAAHRLYNVDTYSSECRDNLHGHSYNIYVKIGRNELNDAGMVMDFKLFKEVVNDVIIDRYDHSCILRDSDPILPVIQENCSKVHTTSESPTAEWMCEYFSDLLIEYLDRVDPDVLLLEIAVQETENNLAVYEPRYKSIKHKRAYEEYDKRMELQSAFLQPVDEGGAIPV